MCVVSMCGAGLPGSDRDKWTSEVTQSPGGEPLGYLGESLGGPSWACRNGCPRAGTCRVLEWIHCGDDSMGRIATGFIPNEILIARGFPACSMVTCLKAAPIWDGRWLI